MTRPPLRRRQRGFTIIEAIAVIVITGIVGGFIAVFIQVPVRAYLNSAGRAEASDLADNTMRRLVRDFRLALPNSVRVDATGRYIEYIETKGGLRYLAEDDVDTPGGGTYLSWNNAAALTFTVVGGVPGGRHAPVVGDAIVVYNLGDNQEPGNAYSCSAGPAYNCNRAPITALSATSMTLAYNPFAAQLTAGTPLMSPGKRFQVVSGPVTYGCDAATRRLIRYSGYAYTVGQVAPPTTGSKAILADNVNSCSFSYATLASQRSGMIGVSLTFAPQDGSNPITLLHQIHVDSTP
jgi:MSHA biogenesis protein MshO